MSWEDKCKKCGTCCKHKIRRAPGVMEYTGEACEFLAKNGQCTVYHERKKHHPSCVKLTKKIVREADWLPESCGYRE